MTIWRPFLALACALAACGSGAKAPSGVDAPPGSSDGNAMPDSPGPMNGVYTIPLGTPSGGDQGAFYTATLTASGASFLLDLDTGSTVTGIAGSSCSTCTGMMPLYMPGSGAMATGQTDQAQYADNSGWSGNIYGDKVGLGHGTPDVNLDFVDITSQSTNPQFFAGNEYQGIFGMGPDALLDPGTTAYFDKVTAAGVAPTMAFELCPAAGTMWLGGYDASHVASAPQYTPILSNGVNNAFYSVNMTAMAIGGTNLGINAATFDNPIVDTGTSLFYIPSAAETSLISKLNANAGFKAVFPNQTLTDPTNSNSSTAGCVNAASGTTDAAVDAMLPPLSMTFGTGAAAITVSAAPLASYFYNAGGGQYCLAVYGGGDQGEATMGDTIMRAFVTIIDIGNMKVGFAPTNHCVAPLAGSGHGRIRERGRGPHHVRRG